MQVSKPFAIFAPTLTYLLLMIQLHAFCFNAFAENTYLLYQPEGEAILVDPGCYALHEKKQLLDFLTEQRLRVTRIINTHAHIDHVLGVAFAKQQLGVPFALHKLDEPHLRAVKTYAPNYGFPAFDEPEVEEWLEEGNEIQVGDSILRVVFTPGHAPGHIVLVCDEQQFVIGGDVLFRGSIGRTDLPGGDHATLLCSIREQLFTLPDDYTVYPGHGEPTTIGYEKRYNPFFR